MENTFVLLNSSPLLFFSSFNFGTRTVHAKKKGEVLVTKMHKVNHHFSPHIYILVFFLPLVENNGQVPENTPGWIEHHEVIAVMRIVNTTTVNLQESLRRLVTLGGDPLLRKHTERQ